jgi:mono/diheme cytochrome c family protein
VRHFIKPTALSGRLTQVVGRLKLALGFFLLTTAAVASTSSESSTQSATERPLTTYERFLPLAVAGDPTIQHFLGYMFFYGEGVELDYEAAHYWFHQAAEEGDSRAQRNLGIFHSRAIGRVPEKFYDAGEANLWFSLAAANPENPEVSLIAARSYDKFLASSKEKIKRVANGMPSGESVYLGFCAGCHGFDGRAAYPEVPSFARGDRLEKSDRVLLARILHGNEKMPAWGKPQSTVAAGNVLSYVRREFKQGAGQPVTEITRVDVPVDDRLALGEQIYLRFCGGCHGFNGIAWYVNSPSFALRERMEKTDAELKHSIKNGRGAMPSWEYMLQPEQVDALLRFIRTLAHSYESGIMGELRRPDQFLRFRPKGETDSNWTGDDVR